MCTVTYIPLENQEIPNFNNRESVSNTTRLNFILTSNRDERTTRPPAVFPTKEIINGVEITFPLDPTGGGTWIATSQTRTICLLNGAFEPHLVKPTYKHSRGLVPKSFFTYGSLEEFLKAYDFSHIEPFTLVVAENDTLYEVRWNEKEIFYTLLNSTKPHIWSSVTLYSSDISAQRESFFHIWLSQHLHLLSQNPDLIFNFHEFKNEIPENEGILINRNEIVKTVSITSVRKGNYTTDIVYKDLQPSTSAMAAKETFLAA